ncbi:MAG: cob(I)yrinic acid a,c-diamide adenosyltransferase [Candidatus Thalassarchaeum sp.]|jgi:cob(I)alamin adenosyltransferase|nr:cob(I)yrinic acid a,c-diamide adenosyltransferase [Candidatus Thalassarchaeum sp.]|tara:strand:+ start:268 stop:876 length:609 start_codon:yes stop_codon:yes gene_type:complete
MVRITKVHTGAGDSGKTRLLDGTEVGKEHPRVRLYGTIDEVNSQVGVVRMELNRMPGISIDSRNSADEAMGRVQQELFDVGGECSCTPGKLPEQMVLIGSDAGDRLVTEMDSWLENLDPLESFIMPTGSPPVATLHVARTVARRAERHACSMRDIDGDGAVRDEVISYLNRLSDWMFVLGRWITRMTGEEEELWTPLGKRED